MLLFSYRILLITIFFVSFSAVVANSIDTTIAPKFTNNDYRSISTVDSTVQELRKNSDDPTLEPVVYQAQSGIYYTYRPFPKSRFLTFPYFNVKRYLQLSFREEKVPEMVAMIASTAILIGYDQPIYEETRRIASKVGLSHRSTQEPIFRGSVKVGGKLIKLPINFPTDGNTAMYFLGDGVTHGAIASGMWFYGVYHEDLRAKQTGAQLVEAILSTGTVIQILKHSTGRETAIAATAPAGKWRFFPNLKEYGDHVPKYDAYPTGHLATAMATVTVLAENYPEKNWIRPVGYTLMTLCGFAMVNNGVHWASDYPLGISIGYSMAKIVTARGKTVIVEDPKQALKLHRSAWDRISSGPVWKPDLMGFGVSYQLQ